MNDSSVIFPSQELSQRVRGTLWTLVTIGAFAFVASLVMGYAQRAWQIYYVNFVLWTAIAQGGVVFSAAYRITNGTWGEPFRRTGEGMVSFLPVSFVLFIGVFLGRSEIYPWLHEATGKESWLNAPFFFTRDAAVFLCMMWLSYRYVRTSLRPELGQYRAHIPEKFQGFIGRLVRDWEGDDREAAKSLSAIAKLVPAMLISFAVLYSLLGFDLLMSLDPRWYSTLYGWLFFLHGFYGALVVITILTMTARKAFKLETGFTTRQFHDLGRLVMGFCMLSGGFYWSQYLVIWYGNLTEEIPYLLMRFRNPLWAPFTWYYIIFAFFFPLVIFLSRRAKEKPAVLVIVASIILSSLFVERFLAVAPFLWHESYLPFGIMELLVSLAFAAGFALAWFKFISMVPLISKKV
ncbi:MAG: hypothetical protein WBW71_13405 [Bacteroidota bacterium]